MRTPFNAMHLSTNMYSSVFIFIVILLRHCSTKQSLFNTDPPGIQLANETIPLTPPPHAFSASSVFDNRPEYEAHKASFKLFASNEDSSSSAWCPGERVGNDLREWLQVDFDQLKLISILFIEGREFRHEHFEPDFLIQYQRKDDPAQHWHDYRFRNGSKLLQFAYKNNHIVARTLDPPIIAKRLRLYPYHETRRGFMCLRLALYGTLFNGKSHNSFESRSSTPGAEIGTSGFPLLYRPLKRYECSYGPAKGYGYKKKNEHCSPNGIIEYAVPEGDLYRLRPPLVLNDTIYDGLPREAITTPDTPLPQSQRTYLVGGLGLLTDKHIAPINCFLDDPTSQCGQSMIGWRRPSTSHTLSDKGSDLSMSPKAAGDDSSTIELQFAFDQVRKFTSLHLHAGLTSPGFNKLRIQFSSGGRYYDRSQAPITVNIPKDKTTSSSWLSFNLAGSVGRWVRLTLWFSHDWIILSEVTFKSEPLPTGSFVELEKATDPVLYSDSDPKHPAMLHDKSSSVLVENDDQTANHLSGQSVDDKSFSEIDQEGTLDRQLPTIRPNSQDKRFIDVGRSVPNSRSPAATTTNVRRHSTTASMTHQENDDKFSQAVVIVCCALGLLMLSSLCVLAVIRLRRCWWYTTTGGAKRSTTSSSPQSRSSGLTDPGKGGGKGLLLYDAANPSSSNASPGQLSVLNAGTMGRKAGFNPVSVGSGGYTPALDPHSLLALQYQLQTQQSPTQLDAALTLLGRSGYPPSPSNGNIALTTCSQVGLANPTLFSSTNRPSIRPPPPPDQPLPPLPPPSLNSNQDGSLPEYASASLFSGANHFTNMNRPNQSPYPVNQLPNPTHQQAFDVLSSLPANSVNGNSSQPIASSSSSNETYCVPHQYLQSTNMDGRGNPSSFLPSTDYSGNIQVNPFLHSPAPHYFSNQQPPPPYYNPTLYPTTISGLLNGSSHIGSDFDDSQRFPLPVSALNRTSS